MYNDLDYPAFLSHPSLEPEVFGKLDFHRDTDPYCWSWSTASVLGHCNGLLLYEDKRGLHVVNPATQRRALLPPLPPPPFGRRLRGFEHLVFDPAESPHYNVLLVPEHPGNEEVTVDLWQKARDEPSVEWSASTWVLCVFSSCTGQWEERAFAREGEAAGMSSDEVLQGDSFHQSCSTYWRGVFYVQCNGGVTVMRISLSNNKYRVIKMPTEIGRKMDYYDVYLGRSKEGLCCASFHDWYKLRVWILDGDDSGGKMEWVLKHHIDIQHSVSRVKLFCEENEGPWKLQDANCGEDYGQQNLQDSNNDEDGSNSAVVKSKVEWDSDSDGIVDNDIVQNFSGFIRILGFHPYKDAIFLDLSLDRAVAYHLNTSMVQDLGKVCPYDYGGPAAYIKSSFVYTPCLMGEFPENKSEAHVGG